MTVRAKPGGKAPGIVIEDDVVTVTVRERATEGKANAAIGAALARALGIAPSRIALLGSGRARIKRFAIDGLTDAEILARLR